MIHSAYGRQYLMAIALTGNGRRKRALVLFFAASFLFAGCGGSDARDAKDERIDPAAEAAAAEERLANMSANERAGIGLEVIVNVQTSAPEALARCSTRFQRDDSAYVTCAGAEFTLAMVMSVEVV